MKPNYKAFAKVQLFERHRRRTRSRASPCQLAALRIRDLNRLFQARYGLTLPDDDAGREDMLIAMHHLAHLKNPIRRMDHWLGVWCPWISLAERNSIAADVMLNPMTWKADALGWRLHLIDEDRTYLGITTIGAVDCSKRERTIRRKARKTANARAWRLRQKSAYTP